MLLSLNSWCVGVCDSPTKVALALEHGCDGVVLLASVLGPKLEDLLDACTIMGTEAIVEVGVHVRAYAWSGRISGR